MSRSKPNAARRPAGQTADGSAKFWREIWHENPLLAFLLAFLGCLTIAFAFFAVGAGAWFFWNYGGLLDRGDDQQRWVNFATYMGFVAQTIVGGATLTAALYLSGVLTKRLEYRRTDEAQSREIIRLSEKMVDTEFYIKVMYPAWEVALKWMDDGMPGIDAYRASVVGAEVRMPKIYRQGQGDKALAESNPRTHPHYQFYDVPSPGGQPAVINELSESLAFATWVRFWRNIQFLIDEQLLDKAATRALLREWYLWWAPFMTEFLRVCEEVKTRVDAAYGLRSDEDDWRQSSTCKLLELHETLGVSMHEGRESEAALAARVATVADGMIGHFFSAIDSDPNYELVSRDVMAKRNTGSSLSKQSPQTVS